MTDTASVGPLPSPFHAPCDYCGASAMQPCRVVETGKPLTGRYRWHRKRVSWRNALVRKGKLPRLRLVEVAR